MALIGKAALAMWWDMAPAMRHEFEDWHSHEHFRERLAIPGFLRASRWSGSDGGEAVFQIYELEAHETLSSPDYLACLNSPSPWSKKMMPHHRNMVRSQCRVMQSAGSHLARHALTIRLSPALGRELALQLTLNEIALSLIDRPGCVGAHLLRHVAPAIPLTVEQKLRGADQFADWVFIVNGYDESALKAIALGELAPEALAQSGAVPDAKSGMYTLSLSAIPAELF